jgi:flagellar hook-associated protein 3 FlgL
MITYLDPNNAQFLSQVNSIHKRLERAQNQLSSGKKLNTVSDDPDQISSLLSARAALEAAKQIGSNLGRVQTEVNGAEKALQQASKAFERARVLGAQGASSNATADSRATLATEVDTILDQLVGLTRTTVEGRYIFSGDQDQTAPYSIDLTQATPVSAYLGGTTNTREIQHPNGSRFTVGKTAQEIFDSSDASQSVFANLTALRNALRGNDEAGVRTALDSAHTAGAHLERQLAYYGTTQNRVTQAVEFGQKLQQDVTEEVGNIENADIVEAILEMQQAQTQLQSALQSKAQLNRQSLFDFLR